MKGQEGRAQPTGPSSGSRQGRPRPYRVRPDLEGCISIVKEPAGRGSRNEPARMPGAPRGPALPDLPSPPWGGEISSQFQKNTRVLEQ